MVVGGGLAEAHDLEVAVAVGLQHHLPLLVVQRHRDAEVLLPHRLHRDGHLPVALSRVVEDLDGREPRRPPPVALAHRRVARLGQEGARPLGVEAATGEGIGAGGALGRHLLRVAGAGEVGDVVRRRPLPAARSDRRAALVDGQIERAAHPHVVERRPPGVQLVPVHGEVIAALVVLLAGEERLVLGRQRHVVAEIVELARFVEVHAGVVILDLEPDDVGDRELAPIPVERVRLHGDLILEVPAIEHVGAVRDQALRPGPPVPLAAPLEGLDHVAAHGEEGVRAGELEEVRRGVLQLHLEREVVGGAHAQHAVVLHEVRLGDPSADRGLHGGGRGRGFGGELGAAPAEPPRSRPIAGQLRPALDERPARAVWRQSPACRASHRRPRVWGQSPAWRASPHRRPEPMRMCTAVPAARRALSALFGSGLGEEGAIPAERPELAETEELAVLQRVEVAGRARGGGGPEHALPRVLEVAGGDRAPVGPARPRAGGGSGRGGCRRSSPSAGPPPAPGARRRGGSASAPRRAASPAPRTRCRCTCPGRGTRARCRC